MIVLGSNVEVVQVGHQYFNVGHSHTEMVIRMHFSHRTGPRCYDEFRGALGIGRVRARGGAKPAIPYSLSARAVSPYSLSLVSHRRETMQNGETRPWLVALTLLRRAAYIDSKFMVLGLEPSQRVPYILSRKRERGAAFSHSWMRRMVLRVGRCQRSGSRGSWAGTTDGRRKMMMMGRETREEEQRSLRNLSRQRLLLIAQICIPIPIDYVSHFFFFLPD